MTVFRASSAWYESRTAKTAKTKKKGRKRLEQDQVMSTFVCGTLLFIVYLLSSLSSSSSPSLASNNNHDRGTAYHNSNANDYNQYHVPSEQDWNKVKTVAKALESMLTSLSAEENENSSEGASENTVTTDANQQQQQQQLLQAKIALRLRSAVEDTSYSAKNPVQRALLWLAAHSSDSVSLQRFAVAVLYHFTDHHLSWVECAPYSTHCPTPVHVLSDHESECLWHGLTCDSKGRLIRMEWTATNLTSSRTNEPAETESSLPYELALLSHLELLWWSDNPHLRLTLQQQQDRHASSPLQHLTHCLKSLSLSHTALEGTIPSSLYQMTALQSLRLYETKLSGTISSDISRLQHSMAWLWLHNNLLTGTFPSEAFRAFQRLEGFTIHGNRFSNEPNLCHLRTRKGSRLNTYWTDCISCNDCCTKCFG